MVGWDHSRVVVAKERLEFMTQYRVEVPGGPAGTCKHKGKTGQELRFWSADVAAPVFWLEPVQVEVAHPDPDIVSAVEPAVEPAFLLHCPGSGPLARIARGDGGWTIDDAQGRRIATLRVESSNRLGALGEAMAIRLTAKRTYRVEGRDGPVATVRGVRGRGEGYEVALDAPGLDSRIVAAALVLDLAHRP